VGAGEGDADGVEKLLALDAGGGLDFVHPGLEDLGSDGAGVGADAAGHFGQNGAGRVDGQDGGVLLVGVGGFRVEGDDGCGLDR